ncbi:Golgi-specific brefeldin A-resistance guanine nucleotide exchange factor 1 [Hypsibius exemplaris]|uniref:Golgi-specific brefeldin A-resistance guanine nucleotide exchange factor 1 n=1 Tax=Hypsibius exemplaris TaxID=2072580 RepID=A0A1W0XAA3_HYPEX|nr:Golgi-specific brefeldin A-resistance guanine nucleotide exchange factor 1 [Hypsibius exemplaris]
MARARHIHVMLSEVNIISAAMKRVHRWNQQEDRNQLLEKILTLKQILSTADDLDQIDAKTFLLPFLDIIRAEETSAVITKLALATIDKVISLKMLETRTKEEIAAAVDIISDAVTHTRFVGSDPASDEGVLMSIIHILKDLLVSTPGNLLTNESVCEIAGSLFRMCLEPRLSELLRKICDTFLVEVIQHIFTRLPEFTESQRDIKRTVKKLHRLIKRKAPRPPSPTLIAPETLDAPPVAESAEPAPESLSPANAGATEMTSPDGACLSKADDESPVDLTKPIIGLTDGGSAAFVGPSLETPPAVPVWSPAEAMTASDLETSEDEEETPEVVAEKENADKVTAERREFINDKGVKFRAAIPKNDENGAYIPYGLPALQEVLRFMTTLIHPYDKNPENNLNLGLQLLGTVMETAARALPKYATLMSLIENDLCRNLIFLLQNERLSIFTLALQLAFYVFEAMRGHLKLQLEMFLTTLMNVVSSEAPKVTLEHKEAALDMVLRFWRLPDFVSELYLNYDCDMYCSNLFEDLTKLLSKNAFPVNGLNTVHLYALDCLLTAIDSIEKNCQKLAQGAEPYRKEDIFSRAEYQQIRLRKRHWTIGTEQFNIKPAKGLEYLQKNLLLKDPLEITEVVTFLRENHRLDKAMIADLLGNRKNTQILIGYVKSFKFSGKRIDEALREYLEAFRLPGESPLVAHFMEHFASNWHVSNKTPFRHQDCAFTLAYAILMLNTDLHTKKGGKLHKQMTIDEFKKMVKGINYDKAVTYGPEVSLDLDPQFLETLYEAISKEEIIMPAEHIGLVKEMYDWKVLLRRSLNQRYDFGKPGILDADIFAQLWGPTVAALSYAFDKTVDDYVIRKSIIGFKKCAVIAASSRVMSSEVFDNIIITLCKFSTLQNSYESSSTVAVIFGQNMKAQLATKTVFSLAHRHGDILREGWKNIVECIVQLFRARLLPEDFTQGEDFVKGLVPLLYDEPAPLRQESGLFSALVSYITSDSGSKSSTTLHEENEYRKMARACVDECEIIDLVKDSKFLQIQSLKEFLGALMSSNRSSNQRQPDGGGGLTLFAEEQSATICLELLVRVLIENRDRLGEQGMKFWPVVHEYLYTILLQEGKNELPFRIERAVVGLLRLAVRFLRRHDTEVQQDIMRSLRLLLGLRSQFFFRLARQIAFALYQLFQANASSSIKSREDWKLLFTLLECSGAGIRLPAAVAKDLPRSESQPIGVNHPDVDPDRGYTSDGEIPEGQAVSPAGSGTWLMVGKEGEVVETAGNNGDAYALSFAYEFYHHDMDAFFSAIDSLHFLIRETGQITPENIPSMVHCLCVFAEASMNGSNGVIQRVQAAALKRSDGKAAQQRLLERKVPHQKTNSTPSSPSEEENQQQLMNAKYQQRSNQILDLMLILHGRTLSLCRGTKFEATLWSDVWCHLLRGIARICCDNRKGVRMDGLNYLHRALLIEDLKTLSPSEWEDCLHKVLFPLLSSLRQSVPAPDRAAMEETRVRVSSLLCKVFLQHLTPLLSLNTFGNTWMTVLDHLEQYLKLDTKSDLLREAVLESIKNMLLVMSTAGVFQDYQGSLWEKTRAKMDSFVPGLTQQLIEASQAPRVERPVQPIRPASPPEINATPSPISFDVLQAASAVSQNSPGLPLLLDPGILQGFQMPTLSSPVATRREITAPEVLPTDPSPSVQS